MEKKSKYCSKKQRPHPTRFMSNVLLKDRHGFNSI